MKLKRILVLSVFITALVAGGSAWAEEQYYNGYNNQYADQDAAYIPPKYSNGKYYPNEYQGAIGYNGAQAVTENDRATRKVPQNYYNYY